MKFRIGLFLGFGVGYYLGARAGRERYEQLRGLVAHTPLAKVQAAYELGLERMRERTSDTTDAVVPPSPNYLTVSDLGAVAPAFVELAHRVVWATVATVDPQGRPRSRILHPYWIWDGTSLVGWIATGPTATKRAHLEHSPFVSVTYWTPTHDTCTAECRATWALDDETREWLWRTFANAPAPVGYDPAIIPAWSDGPTSPAFAALRLDPWRLRVLPGSAMGGGPGEILRWSAD